MNQASAPATLTNLEVRPGTLTPAFWGTRTSFAVTLPFGTPSISLIPTAAQEGTSIRISGQACVSGQAAGPFPLEVGRNHFAMEVSAPGLTGSTYEIKVFRGSQLPNWVKLLEAGPFAARDSAGELVFQDRFWLLGGYLPELVGDVWSSGDGLTWEKAGQLPDAAAINIPVTFVHDGKMWVSSNDGRFWSSPNGRQWNLVCEKAPWSGRYGAGSAVFDGRMWVLGGGMNDVWSSHDGVKWTLELEAAPWSRRQLFSNVVVHRQRLWVIGGGLSHYQPFKSYADVWSSPDGRHWTRELDAAPWPGRIWSSCVVYRGRMWLLGGFRSQPTWNNFNDLWYSADGRDWRLLATDEVWEPRHELSAAVVKDKLWMVAGNAWPLKNDVWQLDIPGLSFLTQPVLEEFVHAEYRYQVRADFNRSAQPVRYRLQEGPAWLNLDPNAGLLRGTPEQGGSYPVAIEAYDDSGESATQAYRIEVISS